MPSGIPSAIGLVRYGSGALTGEAFDLPETCTGGAGAKRAAAQAHRIGHGFALENERAFESLRLAEGIGGGFTAIASLGEARVEAFAVQFRSEVVAHRGLGETGGEEEQNKGRGNDPGHADHPAAGQDWFFSITVILAFGAGDAIR